MLPPYLQQTDAGCLLHVRVIPGSRKTEVTGVQEGCLRIKIAAPPVDGAANKALTAFLARKLLGVPRSKVTLLRGAQARHKQLQIALPASTVAGLILVHLQ